MSLDYNDYIFILDCFMLSVKKTSFLGAYSHNICLLQ